MSESTKALLDAIDGDVRSLLRQVAESRFTHAERTRDWSAAEERWALRLIEVADAFDRVLQNVESRPEKSTDQMRIWLGNFKAVRRLLDRQLVDGGAARMPAEPAFDPLRHTIVETVEDPARAEGDIVEVLRPGSERAGKVIRKAEVRVIRNEM
jgi:molecular chaperone GrpE (heat shock protein)